MLLMYIDRMPARLLTISSLTVHRYLIAGVCVISKAMCDAYCTNAHYARVGGITTAELNTLELEFLFLVKWQLWLSVDSVQSYYS